MGSDDYGERLRALEVQISHLIEVNTRLEAKLDAYQTNFVPRAELTEMFRLRDEKIARLEEEFKTKRQNWPIWVGIIVSTAVGIYSAIHGGK